MSVKYVHHSVAIVGAGASGLIVASELISNGINDFIIIEKSNCVGGVYNGLYKGARLVSSNNITYFSSDIPDPEVSRFLTTEEYLGYLRDFSAKKGVDMHIHFNTCVQSIDRTSTGWVIFVERDGGVLETMACDKLVMCSGLHSLAKKATLNVKGAPFAGEHIHAKQVTDLSVFDGKNVLFIGGGEMASDLALFSAQRSQKTYISIRGMGRLVPRHLAGAPLDTSVSRAFHRINRNWDTAGPVQWRFRATRELEKKADKTSIPVHDLLAEWNREHSGELTAFSRYGTKTDAMAHAVLNHGAEVKPMIAEVDGYKVTFIDGSSADIDLIVSCLGFDKNPDIFPKDLQSVESNELYLRMFHPRYGSDIAFVGMLRPEAGGIPPMSEMQARYLALVLRGKQKLPSTRQMRTEIVAQQDRDMKQFPIDSCRYPGLTDFFFFLEKMAQEIGCTPPWRRLMLRPRAFWKVLMGPLSVVQYRLRGPGSDPAKSLDILERMTWSKLMPDVVFLFPLFIVSELHRRLIARRAEVIERTDGYGVEVHFGPLPRARRKGVSELLLKEFMPRSPIFTRLFSVQSEPATVESILTDFDKADIACLLTYTHDGKTDVVGSIFGIFVDSIVSQTCDDSFAEKVHRVVNSVGFPVSATQTGKRMIVTRLCVARNHSGRHRSQALIRRLMFEIEAMVDERPNIKSVEVIAQAATEPAIKAFRRAGFAPYQEVSYNEIAPWGPLGTARTAYNAAWQDRSVHERLVGMVRHIQ